MLSHVRNYSDQRLLRIAYDVGQEIDRRWHHDRGRKAVQFKDCMDVFVYFHYRLWDKKQEQLIMLMVDTRHALIEERIVTLGTINSSLIHAREIFAPAPRPEPLKPSRSTRMRKQADLP